MAKNETFDLIVNDLELPEEGNLQMPSLSLFNLYSDKKNRIIWINKDIEENLFEDIKVILRFIMEDEHNQIPKEKRQPIKIFIHSYGGNVDSALALCDLMKLSDTPIYTYNINACMSAAALIYVCGHKRFAFPNSTVLFHKGSGGAGGTFDQVVAQTENYKKIMEMMQNIILTHTSIPKATLTKNLKKEWYLYTEDQIKYNVTDVIMSSIREAI